MIHTGLVSVSFRPLSPREIVDLVARAGLEGIEWGGDIHVPHGEVERAKDALRMTRDAGLAVAAYGSYYRAGESEAEGLSFGRVLETAAALEAPTLRVWAGKRGSADADRAYRRRVAEDARRIAGEAQEAGIVVAFEYHGKTLTDTHASARRLLEEADHPNLRTYWQASTSVSVGKCLEGLEALLPYLANLHVYHWVVRGGKGEKSSLADGAEAWARYLEVARRAPGDRFAMIEFVRGDTPEQFLEDAETLRRWVGSPGA